MSQSEEYDRCIVVWFVPSMVFYISLNQCIYDLELKIQILCILHVEFDAQHFYV